MSAAVQPTSGPMPREELVVWLDYAVRLRRVKEASDGAFDMVKQMLEAAEEDIASIRAEAARKGSKKGRR